MKDCKLNRKDVAKLIPKLDKQKKTIGLVFLKSLEDRFFILYKALIDENCYNVLFIMPPKELEGSDDMAGVLSIHLSENGYEACEFLDLVIGIRNSLHKFPRKVIKALMTFSNEMNYISSPIHFIEAQYQFGASPVFGKEIAIPNIVPRHLCNHESSAFNMIQIGDPKIDEIRLAYRHAKSKNLICVFFRVLSHVIVDEICNYNNALKVLLKEFPSYKFALRFYQSDLLENIDVVNKITAGLNQAQVYQCQGSYIKEVTSAKGIVFISGALCPTSAKTVSFALKKPVIVFSPSFTLDVCGSFDLGYRVNNISNLIRSLYSIFNQTEDFNEKIIEYRNKRRNYIDEGILAFQESVRAIFENNTKCNFKTIKVLKNDTNMVSILSDVSFCLKNMLVQ